jgi:hypothetical protein
MFSAHKYASIPITMAQINLFQKGSAIVPRGNLVPAYNIPITKFINVDKADRNGEPIETHEVEVAAGRLFGTLSFGAMEVTNRGPYATMVKVTNPDGSKGEKELKVGEKIITSKFEGRMAMSFFDESDTAASRALIGFDRHFFSNFVGVRAVRLIIGGTLLTIESTCLEAIFQDTKAVTTGDLKTLEEALAQNSCPKLKKYMSTASVPKEWFEGADGEESLAYKVMRHLQAWCVTCPTRHAMLKEVMEIAMAKGVLPENVQIVEYTDDRNYGCDVVPGDFMPLLAEDCFAPKGRNFLGPVISAIACQVVKLDTHANYVTWYKETFPPLFVLKPDAVEEVTLESDSIQADVDPSISTTLGARFASEVDLAPPEGRTGSNSRTLSA